MKNIRSLREFVVGMTGLAERYIGAIERRAYSLATGEAHVFMSGYANSVVPNLWDRSLEAHA